MANLQIELTHKERQVLLLGIRALATEVQLSRQAPRVAGENGEELTVEPGDAARLIAKLWSAHGASQPPEGHVA